MSEAFYYSKEHLNLKDLPEGVIGIDLNWYLREWIDTEAKLPFKERVTLAEFIAKRLGK